MRWQKIVFGRLAAISEAEVLQKSDEKKQLKGREGYYWLK